MSSSSWCVFTSIMSVSYRVSKSCGAEAIACRLSVTLKTQSNQSNKYKLSSRRQTLINLKTVYEYVCTQQPSTPEKDDLHYLMEYLPVSTFIRLLFSSCTDPTAHWNRTGLPLYFASLWPRCWLNLSYMGYKVWSQIKFITLYQSVASVLALLFAVQQKKKAALHLKDVTRQPRSRTGTESTLGSNSLQF